MASIHVNIVLDARYKREDGFKRLVISLRRRSERAWIALNESIILDSLWWDAKAQKILPSAKLTKSVSSLNTYLSGQKTDLERRLLRMEDNGELRGVSLSQLVVRLKHKPTNLTVGNFNDTVVEELRKHKKEGNADAYENVEILFRKYADNPIDKVKFFDIDKAFLYRIELRYTAEGHSLNGLAVYLRSLRALFNKAIAAGLIPSECYPFTQYKIRRVKKHKTALDKTQMKLLASLKLRPGSLSELHHRVFFLSFHLRGMNLKDMVKMKVKDIYEGKIHYKRSKTEVPFTIATTAAILEIIAPYLKDKEPEDYVLPILGKIKAHNRKEFKNFSRSQNLALKRWAKKLSLPRTLSLNTARHSWASIGKTMGVNLATISEGLGHSELRTTQIYLDSLPDSMIDEASAQITDLYENEGISTSRVEQTA